MPPSNLDLVPVLVLLIALAVDRFVGEWPASLHPVVWMGNLIRALADRAPSGNKAAFVYGLAMAVGVPALFAGIGAAISHLPGLHLLGGVWLLKGCFAARMLGSAGLVVASALERGDLAGAREGLRSLCSRDPSQLSPGQLAAGATESLAENASDSVVAPLFWYAVAGLPGVAYYRAANTLDSMIGYHGRYEWLGKASARQDDVLNLIPARLTALLLLRFGGWLGLDREGGAVALWRDRNKTESPNAGWPMAAMAGLLRVKLEKPGAYALGDGPPPGARQIRECWRVVSTANYAWALLVALHLSLPAILRWVSAAKAEL